MFLLRFGNNNLATCYYRLERFAEAEALYQEAIGIGYRELTNDSVTGFSLQGLAKLYRDRGRFAEAETHFQQALEMFQTLLHKGHPQIAIGLTNLAKFYREQERFAEAEPLLREVLTRLGTEHPGYQEARRNHLNCLVKMGKAEEAERLSPGFLAWYRENIKSED